MNEFKVIEVMNRAKIEVLKDKKEDYSLNQKIQEYLKDETLFFRIIQTIGVKKELLEEVYKKLINQDVYYDLLNRGKIKDDDESVIVKYKVYRAK